MTYANNVINVLFTKANIEQLIFTTRIQEFAPLFILETNLNLSPVKTYKVFRYSSSLRVNSTPFTQTIIGLAYENTKIGSNIHVYEQNHTPDIQYLFTIDATLKTTQNNDKGTN
jgi:hypothetical protein